MGEEFTTLNAATGELVPMGPEAKRAIRNIELLQQTLADNAQANPQTGVLEAPVDNIPNSRVFDGTLPRRDAMKVKHSQSIAHGLAPMQSAKNCAAIPDIAKINKEFSFWKNAQKVVDETVLRRTGQAKPLGRKLMGTAGVILGGVLGGGSGGPTGSLAGAIAGKTIMDKLEQLTTSTAWGTVSAVNKDRLADALAKGSGAEVEFWVSRIANSISGARISQSSLSPAEAR
jgi:hypothetical protein